MSYCDGVKLTLLNVASMPLIYYAFKMDESWWSPKNPSSELSFWQHDTITKDKSFLWDSEVCSLGKFGA